MPAFPAIVGGRPEVLILGSMPGQRSLTEQRYYAHPQNAFWWIMHSVYGFSNEVSYANKVAALQKAGVAVWDVLHDCERPGSLDSNIVRTSEQANDFAAFFSQWPSITRVLFNGLTAHKLFKRHCSTVIESQACLNWRVLPSTSPAHASMTREQKLVLWQEALQ